MSGVIAQIAFAGSIDESARPEAVDPQRSALVIQNCRVGQTGGLDKRLGYDLLSSARVDTTSRTGGDRLIRLPDGSPAIIDGFRLDVYSENGAYNVTRDAVPECSVERFGVAGATTPDWFGSSYHGTPTVESCAGYYVVSWWERDPAATYTIMAVVVDATSRVVVRGPEAVLTTVGYSDMGMASHDDAYVHIVYRSAANTFSTIVLDLTDATSIWTGWGSPVSLVTDVHANNGVQTLSLDTTSSSPTRAALGYVDTAGTANAVLITFDETGLLETASIADASNAGEGIGLGGTWSTRIWFSYVDGSTGDTNATAYDPADLTTSYSVGGIHVGTSLSSMTWAVASATSAVLAGLSAGITWAYTVVESGGTVIPSGTIQKNGAMYRSTPVRIGAGADPRDLVLADDAGGRLSDGEASVVLCDVSSPATGGAIRPIGFSSVRLERTPATEGPRTMSIVSATKVVTASLVARSGATTSVELIEFDFADRERWSSTTVSNLVLLGGGVVSVFDGARTHELGFLHRPKQPTNWVKVGAGNISLAYVTYLACFEQADAQGSWHISATSDVGQALTLTNQNVTWDVSYPPVTARQDLGILLPKGRVTLYRAETAGGVYQRCTGTNATAEFDPTNSQVTLTDSEASTASNANLYRQPGILGTPFNREAPPGLTHIVSYNGMVVGVDDTRRVLWYSGQVVDGEPPWFSAAFRLVFPDEGPITGLGIMDGALYVFKRRAIYAVTGITPSDNGQQGGFGEPRRLAADFGCVSHRSIVSTPLGIFYRSDRGIELLDRGQQVINVGRRVQRTLATYPEVMAATMVPHQDVVIFECCSTVTNGRAAGTGVSLVFDLSAKEWVSVDHKRLAGGTLLHPAQDAAVIYYNGRERYAWLDSSGRLFVESDDYLENDGTMVLRKYEGAWLKAAGLGGEQSVDKVIVLAERHTSHDLTVSLGYNYLSTYPDTRAFTDTELDALTPLWLDIATGNDRLGQAVRVKVEDAAPSAGSLGSGRASEWIAMTFEGTGRPGAKRTSTGQR